MLAIANFAHPLHQLLFCVSLFRPITSHSVQPKSAVTAYDAPAVTAVTYLDSAMSQITVSVAAAGMEDYSDRQCSPYIL